MYEWKTFNQKYSSYFLQKRKLFPQAELKFGELYSISLKCP